MAIDRIMYEIACSFPALQFKGVEDGRIPGITPTDFYDLTLSDYLYKGAGGVLSSGEFLILELLLNLYNSSIHTNFNLGEAVHILDPKNMDACMNAINRMYFRK
jgi:hypothetical protein